MSTTDDTGAATPQDDATQMEQNLARIEDLMQRLTTVMQDKRHVPPALQGPGQDLFIRAASDYMTDLMGNPARLMQKQMAYWTKSVEMFSEATQSTDPRFADPMWQDNPWFNLIKQQYLANSQMLTQMVDDIDGLSDIDTQRLRYFTQQIADMFAPTNFLGTNPEVLKRAMETQGQSLVDGMENMVRDLERSGGEMMVTLADRDAFTVGDNIATTPGKVVYRNRLLELIQYTPTTKQVHDVPLLIFPPWINKFYILDLSAKNSLIKWIVDQGYTLFVVSWVNPDASYADVGLDDYITEGYLDAIAQVKAICDVPQINTVGYCIAGTTLALTLALLEKRGDSSIASATFFTTMTDFADQGEFGVFLTPDFMDGIAAEARKTGVLESFYMARTFSYLRSNDLIYGPAIRSYMMGQAPPAFDLLYWNGDGTNLPARMTVEYLHDLCRDNKLADGGIDVLGETLHLSGVKTPLCAVACEGDHIAAWKSSYGGVRQMGAEDKTFILAESGHIAGIVNPPTKRKYGHYLNPDWAQTPDAWLQGAEKQDGSWWPTWDAWLAPRSGDLRDARDPGGPDHPALADAPGTYVRAPLSV